MTIRFTLSVGNWVIFHIFVVLFAHEEEESKTIDLTSIGGDNIAPDQEDEELGKHRRFGFGRP
jgi:hypothetical protein